MDSASSDEIEHTLIKWVNTLNTCKPIKGLKEFTDGTIFLHLAELILGSNQVTPKCEEKSNGGTNKQTTIGNRYNSIRNILDNYLKLDSTKVINFSALLIGDNDEIIKIAILLLIAVVLFYTVNQTNSHILNPLYRLEPSIQTFIQECLEMILSVENEMQLCDSLSNVVAKKKVHYGYQSSPVVGSRKRRYSKEFAPPPPIDSPLKEFISSSDLKYQVALKEKKKEIAHLQNCITRKEQEADVMYQRTDNLQKSIHEKDDEIKELKGTINNLKPYRELVEMNDPDQLDLKQKIAFLEEKYKECNNCAEQSETIRKLDETITKIKVENENLEKDLSCLKTTMGQLEVTVTNKNFKINSLQNIKEDDNKRIADLIQQTEKYKFTSDLYQRKYESLSASKVTPSKHNNSEGQIKDESKEEIKIKIEKGSPKPSPDKNAIKVKELQSKITDLNRELRKIKKSETNLRRELEHITSQYGSSVNQVQTLESEIIDLKNKLSNKEEEFKTSEQISQKQEHMAENNSKSESEETHHELINSPEYKEFITDDLAPSLRKIIDDQNQELLQIRGKLTLAQKEHDNLQKENDKIVMNYQSEITRLEGSLNQFSAELTALQQEYQKLLVQKEMSEKDMEVKTVILKENYDQMSQEKEENDIKLQQLEENRICLFAELEQLQRQLTEMEALKQENSEQIIAQKQELESNKLIINELNGKNSALTNQMQELSKSLKKDDKSYNKKLNEFKNENNKLVSELDQSKEKLSKLEAYSNELKIKLDQVVNEEEKLLEQLTQVNAKLNEYEVDKNCSSMEIEKLNTHIEQLEEQKQQLTLELEQFTQSFNQWNVEKQELLTEKEQLNINHESNKQELLGNIAKLNLELEQEKNEKGQLYKELESTNPKLSQLENDKSQLLTELKHLRGKCQIINSEKRKLEELNHNQNNEITQISLNLAKMQKELHVAKNNYEKSERKYSECRKELEYTGEQLSELKKARERQNRDIIKLEASKESEINELKVEKRRILKMYEEKCKISTAEIEKKSKEIKALQNKLEDKEKTCNRLNEILSLNSKQISTLLEDKTNFYNKSQDLEKGLKLEKEITESEIKKLEDDLKEKDNLLKNEMNQLKSAKEEMNKTISEKDEIMKSMEILQIEHDKKDKELKDLKMQLETKEQHKDDIDKMKAETEAQLKQLKAENDEITHSLKNLQCENQTKTEKITELNNILEAQRKDIENKSKESKELLKEVERLTHANQTLFFKFQKNEDSFKSFRCEKDMKITQFKIQNEQMESQLQEWKIKANENSNSKELLDKEHKWSATLEKNYKDLTVIKERIQSRNENLINRIRNVETEKENRIKNFTQERRRFLRRIEVFKMNNKKHTMKIEELLTEIEEVKQRRSKEYEDLQNTLAGEILFLQQKNSELKSKETSNKQLNDEIEAKKKEMVNLQEQLKELEKFTKNTKILTHNCVWQEIQIKRFSKRMKILRKTVNELRKENRILKKKLNDVIKNPDETENTKSQLFTKVLQLEIKSQTTKETMDSQNSYIKKLEKLLDLEEEKNKRLFMRLKATEYALFKMKEDQELPSVLIRKTPKRPSPRIIYREGSCGHKKLVDDELIDGQPDFDMPGLRYMVHKEMKDFVNDCEPLNLKRKLPLTSIFDDDNEAVSSAAEENRKQLFYTGPQTVSYKPGMNYNLPKNAMFRSAYSMYYLPSSTYMFSDQALEFGFAVKKENHSKNSSGTSSKKQKALKRLVKSKKIVNAFRHLKSEKKHEKNNSFDSFIQSLNPRRSNLKPQTKKSSSLLSNPKRQRLTSMCC